MHIYELMELAKTRALLTKLRPDEESIWRAIEREYSTTFYTPLHLVSTLDPESVLLNLYENQLERFDLDDTKDLQSVLDNLYLINDPNYDVEKEKEEQEANLKILEEEEERLAEKAKKKEKKKSEAPKELPKSGGINLAYLADLEGSEG